jgi:hypothetical protein
MHKTRQVTIGMDVLQSEIAAYEPDRHGSHTNWTRHNMMLNKLYELAAQNTRYNNQRVRSDKHGGMIPTPVLRRDRCTAQPDYWHADGLQCLRGSTHRLNSTWTILRKTFSRVGGGGVHLKHRTWQFKHFKAVSKSGYCSLSAETSLTRWPTFQQSVTMYRP